MVSDSLYKGKMKQILLAYDVPKETVAAIMMLYKNTKLKVRKLYGGTDFFVIVANVLLDPYLFIMDTDCVLQTSIDLLKEYGFTLQKARSRRYSAQTITNADYACNIVCLTNTPNQAESLLHILELATGGISLYVNADKTEYICFNQKGDIS